jgi:hypothetical protein
MPHMNDFSKLTLSDEEQQLVNNSDWILTKRVIIDKVYQLLGNLSDGQKIVIEKEKKWLPLPVIQSTAKISKGESYRQLPYVLLDYPRCFDAENAFAIRTMFWWGNFFSMTLQLSGTYKQMLEQNISKKKNLLEQHHFFLCINESPWHHHFDNDNYIALKQLAEKEMERIIYQKHFVKLAVKYPLGKWEEIPVLLEKSFIDILELLKT